MGLDRWREKKFYLPSYGSLFALISFLLGFGGYGPSTLRAEEETPAEVFNRICANCHNTNPPPRAMRGEQLRALPPEKIFFALDKGPMARTDVRCSLLDRNLE
jgi:hypothetical protein